MIDKNLELISLSEKSTTRFWRVSFDELSFAERVFVCVWELEAEVNNGGFELYFLNYSGDNSHFVVQSLLSIGANKAAALVDKAIDTVGAELMAEPHDDRFAALRTLSSEVRQRLSELDYEFYTYPDDLTELLYEFVQQHRNEIQGA